MEEDGADDQQQRESGCRQLPAVPAEQVRAEEERDPECADERRGHRMQPEHPPQQRDDSGKRSRRTAAPVGREQREQPADERQQQHVVPQNPVGVPEKGVQEEERPEETPVEAQLLPEPLNRRERDQHHQRALDRHQQDRMRRAEEQQLIEPDRKGAVADADRARQSRRCGNPGAVGLHRQQDQRRFVIDPEDVAGQQQRQADARGHQGSGHPPLHETERRPGKSRHRDFLPLLNGIR